MKKNWMAVALAVTMAAQMGACLPAYAAGSKDSDETLPMYRLYNPNSGEHFYTSNPVERNNLINVGWNNEGIGWYAPDYGNPVYRLYNKNGGEHHYTMKKGERDALIRLGWSNEGIGWYSDVDERVPLHREYNPNAFSNNHHYTTSMQEADYLTSIGWKNEGIGWYGAAAGSGTKQNGTSDGSSKYTGLHRITRNVKDKPDGYDVDGTGKKDKIGWSQNGKTITFTINGVSNPFTFNNVLDGPAVYAADFNTGDGCKNIVLQADYEEHGYDYWLYSYRDNRMTFMGSLQNYIELAAADGKGNLTFARFEQFSASPGGLCYLFDHCKANGNVLEHGSSEYGSYDKNKKIQPYQLGITKNTDTRSNADMTAAGAMIPAGTVVTFDEPDASAGYKVSWNDGDSVGWITYDQIRTAGKNFYTE